MIFLLISLSAVALIAVISGAFCHFCIEKQTPANVASIVYSNLTFHGLALIESGTVDQNWIFTSIIVTIISFPLVFFVGRRVRRWKCDRS